MIDLVNSYWPTPYYITLFLFVKRGREGASGCPMICLIRWSASQSASVGLDVRI